MRRCGHYAALLTLVLAGCTPSPGPTGHSAYTPPSSSAPGTPGGVAGAFLAQGTCAARAQSGDAVTFHQVRCADGAAVARVTVRRYSGSVDQADCPATTDFVLGVGGSASSSPASSAPSGPQGYACMRNLRAPHPGDPGNGGGPNTIVGDCVYTSSSKQVKETACDGSGAHPPQYKVIDIVENRAECPPSTSLYVGVSHRGVGCAQRLSR